MQDVGDDQFLMLLLVIEADLDDRSEPRQFGVARRLDQLVHRGVDMRAIGRDLFARSAA